MFNEPCWMYKYSMLIYFIIKKWALIAINLHKITLVLVQLNTYSIPNQGIKQALHKNWSWVLQKCFLGLLHQSFSQLCLYTRLFVLRFINTIHGVTSGLLDLMSWFLPFWNKIIKSIDFDALIPSLNI